VALAWRTQVGKVVECYVVRDKGTSESKGSAFIWYVNKAQADAAVEHFNNRHTLPDPTGEMVGSRCGAALGPVEGAAEGALQQNYLQQQQHPCE
jgi:RNA recognition motif-containing protein